MIFPCLKYQRIHNFVNIFIFCQNRISHKFQNIFSWEIPLTSTYIYIFADTWYCHSGSTDERLMSRCRSDIECCCIGVVLWVQVQVDGHSVTLNIINCISASLHVIHHDLYPVTQFSDKVRSRRILICNIIRGFLESSDVKVFLWRYVC